jgi:hypothetical protein
VVGSSGTLLYAVNGGNSSITAYPTAASGNTAPVITIAGSNTLLHTPLGIGFDAQGDMFVTNTSACPPYNDVAITEYAPGANGNVNPIREISGPKTMLNTPFGVAVDLSGKIYVADPAVGVLVYAANANGNVAPLFVLDAGNPGAGPAPSDVTFDTSGDLFVVNSLGGTQSPGTVGGPGSIFEYAANPVAGATPIAEISGTATQLGDPRRATVDATGNLYVENSSPSYGDFTVYAAGSNGNVAPERTFKPPSAISCGGQTFSAGNGVALDTAGEVYSGLLGLPAGCGAVVYPAGANGTVSPTRQISGNLTGFNEVEDVAIH